MFHYVCSFLMAVLIFSMPFVTLAQQDTVRAEATAAAEADAEADTDGNYWFIIGCFGSIFGMIYANNEVPTVPTSRFLGKSPEYVAIYSDTYTLKAKKLQTQAVTRGCITSGIISAAGCCLYTVGAALATTTTY